jgi:hypothetical protein
MCASGGLARSISLPHSACCDWSAPSDSTNAEHPMATRITRVHEMESLPLHDSMIRVRCKPKVFCNCRGMSWWDNLEVVIKTRRMPVARLRYHHLNR